MRGRLASEVAVADDEAGIGVLDFLASMKLLECVGPTRGRDCDEHEVVVVMPVERGAADILRQASKLQIVVPTLVENRQ